MNIQEAKAELLHTIQAYTAKDDNGRYRIPSLRQRPLLFIGPPGIGKTAIIRQAADECQVGLVSYTMTHHTRQSAVGLPLIEHKTFDGQTYAVTEYTMSEIIASVYDCMERTGKKEGILFLDEINCVSETLSPVMLQFLQNKTFGNHRIPAGWIIAAAGNPKEYNASAREFDIVTLDRVRRIDVEPSLAAWQSYAVGAGIHSSILSYLACRPRSFYHASQTLEEKAFVTARGWEDLSALLTEYERLGLTVTEDFVLEFLACRDIAGDFLSYYQMSQAHRQNCPIQEILTQSLSKDEEERFAARLAAAPCDETFSITGWLLSGVAKAVADWQSERKKQERLVGLLTDFQRFSKNAAEESAAVRLARFLEGRRQALQVKEENEIIPESESAKERLCLREMEALLARCKGSALPADSLLQQTILEDIERRKQALQAQGRAAAHRAEHAISFLAKALGTGEEMVSFLAGLQLLPGFSALLQEFPLPSYEEYAILLQIQSREKQLEKIFGGEQ